ncbi:unnamed protein product [Pieris brassicae]|uniref:Uncharacterized protein n=1 Tax=Pieris brassicae TaxID=7116 RepID=A0A9P0X802_PIEBR|nr:unnamed protein product [Pieris brassicae]
MDSAKPSDLDEMRGKPLEANAGDEGSYYHDSEEKVTNWKEHAKNRDRSRIIVEEAKTCKGKSHWMCDVSPM